MSETASTPSTAERNLLELEHMAARSRRILEDPRKARWHAETRAQLEAIEAELARLKARGAART